MDLFFFPKGNYCESLFFTLKRVLNYRKHILKFSLYTLAQGIKTEEILHVNNLINQIEFITFHWHAKSTASGIL